MRRFFCAWAASFTVLLLVAAGGPPARAETDLSTVAPSDTDRAAVVSLWSPDMSPVSSFPAFERGAKGGGFLARGDLDGTGSERFVVGSGVGQGNEVRVFSVDGKQLAAFSPYPKGFKGGVEVAVADTDADGKADIITGPGPGLAATIKVFDAQGKLKAASPTAVFGAFVGGVHLAADDVNGDGKAEVIVSPGPGGGPHVLVLDGTLRTVQSEFFAYDQSMQDGVVIDTIRTPMGKRIVTAPESWASPLVRQFALHSGWTVMKEFYAYDAADRHGVRLGHMDVDRDGNDEIVATSNGGTGPGVRVFDSYGTLWKTADLLDAAYRGSFSFAAGSGSSTVALASIPRAPVVLASTAADKFIDVDLSEQRLYAYEHGRLAKTFLISSGVSRHPTPIGTTTVKKKIPIMDYRWSYGPGNPDNYNLKNVRYNLNIFPHIYIHTAYWHNNFGRPMSHGCVNASLDNARWIYNWADVGTPVRVHP